MADAPLPRPGRSQSAKKRTFSPIDRIQGHEGLLRIYDLSKPAAEPKAMTQNPDKKVTITKASWLANIRWSRWQYSFLGCFPRLYYRKARADSRSRRCRNP